jgi:hypothetical protein
MTIIEPTTDAVQLTAAAPETVELPMADVHPQHRAAASHRDDSYTTHALGKVRDALHGLRYGEVTVVVQDGVVVQVERTEKVRLSRR